jgi:Domain of unknown function (DUF4157)
MFSKAQQPQQTLSTKAATSFFKPEAVFKPLATQQQVQRSGVPLSPVASNSRLPIQAKLTVGQSNDKYEQEADAVANKVVQRWAIPNAVNAMPTITPFNINAAQRACAACEKEDKDHIQRKESGEMTASPSVESRLSATKGGGNPLPESTRTHMESSIGANFSNVRVHTGGEAVQLSQDLSAHAFTHGSDVYFNSGKFAPNTQSGRHLLAHELTHTVQQGSGLQRMIQRSIETSTTCRTFKNKFKIKISDDNVAPIQMSGIPYKKETLSKGFEANCQQKDSKGFLVCLKLSTRTKSELFWIAEKSAIRLGSEPILKPDPIIAPNSPNTIPSPTVAPMVVPFPPLIKLWVNAFIPNSVSGAKKISTGPFAGRTVFPSPPHPFHWGSCFETDDRGFSSVVGASSRVKAAVNINTTTPSITSTGSSDLTFEVDCKTGALICSKVPKPTITIALLPSWTTLPDRIVLLINFNANDPCVSGSPNLAFRGVATINKLTRTFDLVGSDTFYPAFEMYGDFGSGAVTIFNQAPIVDSPFALLAPGLNIVSESLTF